MALTDLVPASAVADLRRMVAEPGGTTYTDAVLRSIIARYPFQDAAGLGPVDTGWVPRYDLNAAAADVWAEKEATAQATAGGVIKTISDNGTTISYAADSVATARQMADYYRKRIAPRLVRL